MNNDFVSSSLVDPYKISLEINVQSTDYDISCENVRPFYLDFLLQIIEIKMLQIKLLESHLARAASKPKLFLNVS